MQFNCTECGHTHDVEESHIPASGMAIQCVECGHRFRIAIDEDGAQGKKEFFLRNDGDVRGPYNIDDFRMLIETGQIDQSAKVSEDKEEWTVVTDVDELSGLNWPEKLQTTVEEAPDDEELSAATQVESDIEKPTSDTQVSDHPDPVDHSDTEVSSEEITSEEQTVTEESEKETSAAVPEDADDEVGAEADVENEGDEPREEDNLFDEGEDDLFGETEEPDDLFSEPEESVAEEETQDTSLAQAASTDEDEPSEDDDIFDDVGGDDLFGDESQEDEKLFDDEEGIDSFEEDEDFDELFDESDSFAFLEDDPEDESVVQTDDVLDIDDAERQQGSDSHVADDLYEDDGRGEEGRIRQPASTGIPEPAPKHQREKQEESEKETDIPVAKVAIVVGVLGLFVVGGGYLAYASFIAPAEDGQGIDPSEVVLVDFRDIRTDNYGNYHQVIESARSQKSLSPSAKAKLAALESLFLIQYPDKKLRSHLDKLMNKVEKIKPKKIEDPDLKKLASGGYLVLEGNNSEAQSKLLPLTDKSRYISYLSNFLLGLSFADAAEKMLHSQPAKESKAAEKRQKRIDQQTSRAIAFYETAVQLNFATPGPHYQIGELHRKIGDAQRAVDRYRKAIEVSKKHGRSQLRIAGRLVEEGEFREAKPHLKLLRKVKSKLSPVEKAEVDFLTGRAKRGSFALSKAIRLMKSGLKTEFREEWLRDTNEVFIESEEYQKGLDFYESIKQQKKVSQKQLEPYRFRLLLKLKEWEKADKIVASMKSKAKNKPYPYYFSGLLNLDQGEQKAARSSLKKALDKDETHLPSLIELVSLKSIKKAHRQKALELLSNEKKVLNARQLSRIGFIFARVLRDFEAARDWFESAVDEDGSYWPAHAGIAEVAIEQKKFDTAIKYLNAQKDKGFRHPDLFFKLADARQKKGELKKAVSMVNNRLQAYPNREDLIMKKGRILFDMEKFEKAEETFRTAYELEPDNVKAYLYVGRSIFQQGKVGKSVNVFRSIIQREPEQRAEVYYWLGRALAESDDQAQALTAYEKATEFSKAIIESRPDILVRRGRIYTDLGYYGRARDDFRNARDYLEEHADIYQGLADVYLERDRYDRAIEVLQKGLEFNAENKHLHYKIGNAYVQEEKRELAVKHLQRAKDLGHEDPKIHRILGYLYRDLGQDDNAVDAFKNYLANADTDKMAASTKKEVINQIERLGGSL